MRTRNLVFAVLVFTLVIAPAGWSQRKPSAPPAVSGEKKEEGGPSLIGGKTLSAWVQDLKSKDPSVVENAIRTIMMFTPAQWETEQTLVPSLTRHVGASDYSSRVNAAMALGMIIPATEKRFSAYVPEAVAALTLAVKSAQAIIRFQAILALGKIGPEAKSAIPELLYSINERDSWEIRKAAAFALGTLGHPKNEKIPPDSKVVAALVRLVGNDTCMQVRLEAAQSLVIVGPPPPASPALKALRDQMEQTLRGRVNSTYEDKTVKIWAYLAAMRMEPKFDKSMLIPLQKYLDADNPLPVRCHAARAIGTIGPLASSSIPRLIKQLEDKEVLAAQWAIWALGQMGEDALKAIPQLKEMLKDKRFESIKPVLEAAIDSIQLQKKLKRAD